MLNRIDRFITGFDNTLRAIAGTVGATDRPSPARDIDEADMSAMERSEAAALMRVDHCGEVCAQALYRGQALTAKSSRVAAALAQAAREETDHLAWCEQRISELDAHVSYLNPLWYGASFGLGMAAGLLGDKISLGFVAATEAEVCRHLDEHLERLPPQDHRSRAVLVQMRKDEAHHRTTALDAGGTRLPNPVQGVMRAVSRLMTESTYRL